MSTLFIKQLEQLSQEMIRMGMLCETAIRSSAKIVLDHDLDEVEKLQDLLDQINEKHREVEIYCLRLLLKRQPVARDLRTVSSALKMITDMDRIGVQSSDIAEIGQMGFIKNVDDGIPIRRMFEIVIKMVSQSIDAFVKQDEDLAKAVIQFDDEVDHTFDVIRESLIDELKDDNTDTQEAMDLLMIAKYLERIGDHAVNIAKWVIFSITGVLE